jgi:hypothetical protein
MTSHRARHTMSFLNFTPRLRAITVSLLALAAVSVMVVGGCAREEAPGKTPAPASVAKPPAPTESIPVLGPSSPPKAYAMLVEIVLSGRPVEEPYAAARAFGVMDDPRSAPLLREAVQFRRITPGMALRAIAELARDDRCREAQAFVIQTLRTSADDELREIAANLLLSCNGRQQADAIAALCHAADADMSMSVRVAAACTCVQLGEERYWAFLTTAARDPDAAVRRRVADDLPSVTAYDASLPLMLDLLVDADTEVAGQAWEPLSKDLHADGPWDSPPRDADEARIMAAAYRKAWEKQRPEAVPDRRTTP